jgi:hypothetical protein
MTDTIRINRAAVLTLWAAVVVGFDRSHRPHAGPVRGGQQRLCQGRVARHHRTQARPGARAEQPAGRGRAAVCRIARPARAVVRATKGFRAVSKGKPCNPAQVEKYLASKFGTRLGDARQAMAELAAAFEPGDLNRRGFRL